jgi:MoaA/NifB/PqqE/SkfB family radical SAM enzyme
VLFRSQADALPPFETLETATDTDRLAKVYVEVTTKCNLSCRTCVRNGWNERLALMPLALYQSLIEQLRDVPGPLTLVFAGYGEPTTHPHFLEMVRLAKDIGARVEVVTNGTCMDAKMSEAVAGLQVERVWFSVDGLTPDRYASIRRGGQFDAVHHNIRGLYVARFQAGQITPEIGLVFVAMKSNVDQLSQLHWLALMVHASQVLVTNLLPHTPDMVEEVLYGRSLKMGHYNRSPEMPHVHLPRMDFDDVTGGPFLALMRLAENVDLNGADLSTQSDYCPFIQAGATAIRVDGEVSPCTPLLHDHPLFVGNRWKSMYHATFGNIAHDALAGIWASDAYSAFRSKVRKFEFSPCVFCGGCGLDDTNLEDCFGNTFPVCGSCLWAQGVVRCP